MHKPSEQRRSQVTAHDLAQTISNLGNEGTFSQAMRLIGQDPGGFPGPDRRGDLPRLVASRIADLLGDKQSGPSLEQCQALLTLVNKLTELAEQASKDSRLAKIEREIRGLLGENILDLNITEIAGTERYFGTVKLKTGGEALIDNGHLVNSIDGRKISKVKEVIALDQEKLAAVVELEGESRRTRLLVGNTIVEKIGGESYLQVSDIKASGDGRVVGTVLLNHKQQYAEGHVRQGLAVFAFVGDLIIDRYNDQPFSQVKFVVPLKPISDGKLRLTIAIKPQGLLPESFVVEVPKASKLP